MLVTYLLLPLAAARPKRGPFPGSKNQRCPPACANNELTDLLDRHCSDKGTAFMSKHHYSSAYHAIFGSIRGGVRSLLEIGIGEDQAPSVASWSSYFPHAQIYAADVKPMKRFKQRHKPGAGVDKDNKRLWWCFHNKSMWQNSRVHLHLDTDATNPEHVARLPLPDALDVIIDDGHTRRLEWAGPRMRAPPSHRIRIHMCPSLATHRRACAFARRSSHKFPDQEATLHLLWPKLRPGGLYIVEDLLVGNLPWDRCASTLPPPCVTCAPLMWDHTCTLWYAHSHTHRRQVRWRQGDAR